MQLLQKVDYIMNLNVFAQEFGKENVYLHIHHHLLCEPYIDHIYGSVIGISQFATREWMRTTEDKDVKSLHSI